MLLKFFLVGEGKGRGGGGEGGRKGGDFCPLFFKFAPKIPFLRIFLPRNFKGLCFKRNPVYEIFKRAICGWSFSTRAFLISSTSEPHCCLSLTWNLRKCKRHPVNNDFKLLFSISSTFLLFWLCHLAIFWFFFFCCCFVFLR